MGTERWHAGPVHLQDLLRETLLTHTRQMLHWTTCTDCDPEGEARLMLEVVGWTTLDFIGEVEARGC